MEEMKEKKKMYYFGCYYYYYYYYFIHIWSNKNDKIVKIYNTRTIHINKTCLFLSYIFL